MIVSMSSVSDRHAALRADVLVISSDRQVDACLNSRYGSRFLSPCDKLWVVNWPEHPQSYPDQIVISSKRCV